MKSARLHGVRDLRIHDEARPAPAGDEALVRVEAIGLCGSDLHFFTTTSTGSLASRFLNAVGLLRNAVSTTLTGFGRDLLTAMALIGLMFYTDWLLAIIAFFAFPTAILPMVRIGRRMRKVSNTTQEQMGQLTTLLDETFQGVRHVKAYGMEEYEIQRADKAIDKVFRLAQKAAVTRNLLGPIMETLGGLAIVDMLIFVGVLMLGWAYALKKGALKWQ